MKRLLIFVIVIICSLFYAGNLKAELLNNPGFEDGDNPYYHGQPWSESTDPAWWWKYGDGGWAAIDRELGEYFNCKGYSVAGNFEDGLYLVIRECQRADR